VSPTAPTPDESREALERQLDAVVGELGDDELRVMVTLARRLLEGQRCYGKLSLATDSRDWKKERSAEIQDLLIYDAFEVLRREGTP
jgi:hypothetical protein